MTFDPRLANITVPVVHGLYCPFFQISGKKRSCMKSRFIVKPSLILFLRSLVPQQRPNGTL